MQALSKQTAASLSEIKFEFLDLLKRAAAVQHPGLDLFLEEVEYYDPLEGCLPSPMKGSIVCLKSIDFFYQHEIRIVATDAGVVDQRLNIQIEVPPGLFELRSFPC